MCVCVLYNMSLLGLSATLFYRHASASGSNFTDMSKSQ